MDAAILELNPRDRPGAADAAHKGADQGAVSGLSHFQPGRIAPSGPRTVRSQRPTTGGGSRVGESIVLAGKGSCDAEQKQCWPGRDRNVALR